MAIVESARVTTFSAGASPDEVLDLDLLTAVLASSPFPMAVVRDHALVCCNPALEELARGDTSASMPHSEAPPGSAGGRTAGPTTDHVWELSPADAGGAAASDRLEQLLVGIAGSGGSGKTRARLRRQADGRCYDVRLTALPGQQAVSVWLMETPAAASDWIAQHERLRVTGEVALGIAHDMHNTLGAIALRISVLKRNAAAMEAQGRNIEALERIVAEGNALVGKFQSLGQAPPTEVQTADLQAVIATAVEIAQSGLKMRAAETGVHVHMEMNIPDLLPPVTGTAQELCQLFVNLLINARDAMPAGGRVLITAEAEPASASADHDGGAGVEGASAVVVRVEDEGTGIPPGVVSRMFDAFFTTKGRSGTGIGLAMARATMTRAGGSISASNRPEGGAAFTLRFRRATAP